MFYRSIIIGIFFMAVGHVTVSADPCPGGTPKTAAQLMSIFDGSIVAFTAIPNPTYPEQWMNAGNAPHWHEQHVSGSFDLIECGDGPHTVGSWGVSGGSTGIITYTYSGGTVYSYNVYENISGVYDFCNTSTTVHTATGIIVVSCP